MNSVSPVFSTVGHFPASMTPRIDNTGAEPWQHGRMVDTRDRDIVPTVSVFRTLEVAIAFVTNRATDLVERGDFEHAGLPFTQSPSVEIECCVFEIYLRRVRDGQTCTFRVTQHPVSG